MLPDYSRLVIMSHLCMNKLLLLLLQCTKYNEEINCISFPHNYKLAVKYFTYIIYPNILIMESTQIIIYSQ